MQQQASSLTKGERGFFEHVAATTGGVFDESRDLRRLATEWIGPANARVLKFWGRSRRKTRIVAVDFRHWWKYQSNHPVWWAVAIGVLSIPFLMA
jgi:hypothetical protein